MDAKTKKLIGFAAVGVVIYELWKRYQVANPLGETIQTDALSNVPIWAQQLSATSATTLDFMGIPQGPGGSDVPGNPGGYFGVEDCILPYIM